uniref:NADH-ubiquinone oxidoreductase chain 2 n=1 Tax=Quadrula quadrula TaxID=52372 RepID=D2DVZ4_QUAQU|nr:NADH dehydrogenase subunit 2 [Quadrula quadrula]
MWPSILLLLTSTTLAVTSSNLLFMWTMMELNMLAFLPIISMNKTSTTQSETSIKYLIPQTLGSNLFMASTVLTSSSLANLAPMLANTALLMKLGSVPFHGWYPSTMRNMNLMASFIMMTWQKITPLLLLTTQKLSNTTITTTSAIMSAMWGSIAGLNQTNLIVLLAFSSINHMSWLLMSSLMNQTVTCAYLTAYSLTALQIILLLYPNNIKTHNMTMSSLLSSNHLRVPFITSILSLAGLPPLMMFSAKLTIIITLIKTHAAMTLAPLLLGSGISLYFYLTLMLTLTTNQEKITPTVTTSMKTATKTIHTLLLVLQLMALPMTISILMQ